MDNILSRAIIIRPRQAEFESKCNNFSRSPSPKAVEQIRPSETFFGPVRGSEASSSPPAKSQEREERNRKIMQKHILFLCFSLLTLKFHENQVYIHNHSGSETHVERNWNSKFFFLSFGCWVTFKKTKHRTSKKKHNKLMVWWRLFSEPTPEDPSTTRLDGFAWCN
jgi:hypothetical protein